MVDVLVPKVVLDGSRIVPLVRQLESSSMTKHMRVYRDAPSCRYEPATRPKTTIQ